MTPKEREEEVDKPFKTIAFLAESFDYKKNDIYPKIESLVNRLWHITIIQNKLHELDHKRINKELAP